MTLVLITLFVELQLQLKVKRKTTDMVSAARPWKGAQGLMSLRASFQRPESCFVIHDLCAPHELLTWKPLSRRVK